MNASDWKWETNWDIYKMNFNTFFWRTEIWNRGNATWYVLFTHKDKLPAHLWAAYQSEAQEKWRLRDHSETTNYVIPFDTQWEWGGLRDGA